MFSGLTTWYWRSNWCTLPWRFDPLPSPEISLVAYSFLCRFEAVWAFPVHISLSIVVLVWLTLRWSCWWDFLGVASDILGDTSHSVLSDHLPLTIFLYPLLQSSLGLRCSNCVIDVSIGLELHKYPFWLVVVFCNTHHLLQGGVLLKKSEDRAYLWV